MGFRGLVAGAAGTVVLEIVTSLDMLARARPPSSLPSTVVRKLAERAGLDEFTRDDDAAPHLRSAAGALLGYGVGLAGAVAYDLVRPLSRAWLPWPLAGAALGLATLLVSEGWATRLGATDWSEWTSDEWAADVFPRTLYGLTVAYVDERLRGAGTDAT